MKKYILNTDYGNKEVSANCLKEALKLSKKYFSNKWNYIYDFETFEGIYRVDNNYRIRHKIELNEFLTKF